MLALDAGPHEQTGSLALWLTDSPLEASPAGLLPRVAHTSRRSLSVCMRPNSAYNHPVSNPKHYYGLNHLHYLTRSTYRRARI